MIESFLIGLIVGFIYNREVWDMNPIHDLKAHFDIYVKKKYQNRPPKGSLQNGKVSEFFKKLSICLINSSN